MQALNWALAKLPAELTDTFVVNGCSAGGLAVYTWIEHFKDIIVGKNANVKLYGLPDSGFFVDYISLVTGDNDHTLKM